MSQSACDSNFTFYLIFGFRTGMKIKEIGKLISSKSHVEISIFIKILYLVIKYQWPHFLQIFFVSTSSTLPSRLDEKFNDFCLSHMTLSKSSLNRFSVLIRTCLLWLWIRHEFSLKYPSIVDIDSNDGDDNSFRSLSLIVNLIFEFSSFLHFLATP